MRTTKVVRHGASRLRPRATRMAMDVPLAARVAGSASLGAGLAIYGLAKKSLDASGAAAAAVVGAATFASSTRLGVTLIAFFLVSSKLTKFKQERKSQIEKEFKPGGQRDWKQVLANGGIPTLLAVFVGFQTQAVDQVMRASASISTASMGAFLGYYACCCGDTWSSELGVLSRAPPKLITTWKTVPPGTNGGVSALGLVAAALGGLFVGMAFALGGYLACGDVQLQAVVVGGAVGFLGSLLDSLLGATVQYTGYDAEANKVTHKPGEDVVRISGQPWLDNDAVNAVSATCCAAMAAWTSLHLF